MKKFVGLFLLVGMVAGGMSSVYAQSATPTATPTSTATATPMATSPSGAPKTGFGG